MTESAITTKPAPANSEAAKPAPELPQPPGNASGIKTNEPAKVEQDLSPTMPVAPSQEETAACETQLAKLEARYETAAPVSGESGCGIARTYNILSVHEVKIEPSTQLTCETALALASWMRGIVEPSVAALGAHVRLTKLRHASTYACRRRNNLAEGKISEHAYGHAIDIQSFEFENRDAIAVVPRAGKGTMEEAFQKTVEAGGCLYFTTALGPGSDAYHENHLHLDIAKRQGGYRMCQ